MKHVATTKLASFISLLTRLGLVAPEERLIARVDGGVNVLSADALVVRGASVKPIRYELRPEGKGVSLWLESDAEAPALVMGFPSRRAGRKALLNVAAGGATAAPTARKGGFFAAIGIVIVFTVALFTTVLAIRGIPDSTAATVSQPSGSGAATRVISDAELQRLFASQLPAGGSQGSTPVPASGGTDLTLTDFTCDLGAD